MMRNEDGVSIAEIMVAVLIMAVALLAMMYMFQFSVKHTSNAGLNTVAIQLAKEKIEQIRGTTFNSIDDSYSAGGNLSRDTYLPSPAETFIDFPGYKRQSKITYLTITSGNFAPYTTASATADIPPTDLIEATVKVEWIVDGATKAYEEKTVIYNNSKK